MLARLKQDALIIRKCKLHLFYISDMPDAFGVYVDVFLPVLRRPRFINLRLLGGLNIPTGLAKLTRHFPICQVRISDLGSAVHSSFRASVLA